MAVGVEQLAEGNKKALDSLSTLALKIVRDIAAVVGSGGDDIPYQPEFGASVVILAEVSGAISRILASNPGIVAYSSPDTNVAELLQQSAIHGSESQIVSNEITKPTTFSALLRQKLADVLPVQVYQMSDLRDWTGAARKMTDEKIIEIMNDHKISLPIKGEERAECVEAVAICLSTPSDNFYKQLPQFYKRDLLTSFLPSGPVRVLDRYSQEIGHNWLSNPTVPKSEALAFRGLVMLNRILEARRDGKSV